MFKPLKLCILPLLLVWVGSCGGDTPVELEVPSIRIPAVHLDGEGSVKIGAFEFSDGSGFCEIDGGRIPAVVYGAQHWEDFDLTVFHVAAPTDSNLHVLYFYAAADTLQTVWYESYTHPLEYESATGHMNFEGRQVESYPELHCLGKTPGDGQLASEISISGSTLNWSGGSGSIVIEQQSYALYPFQFVDCAECGATPADGWYELHSVFLGPNGEIEFGILYMYTDEPDRVELYYRIRFCNLLLGPASVYQANWTLDLNYRPHSRSP